MLLYSGFFYVIRNFREGDGELNRDLMCNNVIQCRCGSGECFRIAVLTEGEKLPVFGR